MEKNQGNSAVRGWVSSLPATIVLVLAVFLSSGQILHSQLLRFGQATWNDYFLLRDAGSIHEPTCDPNVDVDQQVQKTLARLKAEAAADPLNALLGNTTSAADVRQSLLKKKAQCGMAWQGYRTVQSHRTFAVRAYSTIERAVAFALSMGGSYNRLLLCLLLLLCAATATARREHFAIRPPRTRLDHSVSCGMQCVANLLLLVSAVAYRSEDLASVYAGVPSTFFYLHAFWIAGFAVMTAISLWQLLRPPAGLEPGGSWFKVGFTVPLYTWLCLVVATFFFSRGFLAGIGIYTNTMMELTSELLNLALYVWVGMMLKQTRLADLVFDVFRPWNLSPELLCVAVLLVSAVLTAYTGASGAFVMAAGATIYVELVRGGARKPLALAATAMSGSMGVVLAPCLLIVIIAAINGSVTTTELFDSGLKVFAISAGMFVIVALLARRSPLHVASPVQALPGSLRALRPLLPYALIFAGVVLFFSFVLQRGLDEFSAPVILPIAMILMIAYESRVTAKKRRDLNDPRDAPAANFHQRMRGAADDTTSNIGALLMLVALSVCLGGIVERSGVLQMLPTQLGSVWLAMSLLVPILIIIGMCMDPYGAIILVNTAVAKIAVDNGIEPLHFWMIALVAFELGYLMPPVMLNHLLARSVIGDEEVQSAGVGERNLWRRYEQYLLPIAVMLSVLLIVAYVPLIWPGMNHWLFQHIALPK